VKLGYKLMLGVAAIGVASAASFPGELGALYRDSYPTDWTKRQALDVCERTSATFVRFLRSEREECYSRLRNATELGDRSGMWSKHDRGPQLAQVPPTHR